LMTHDIDLCTALMGGAADEVNGQSRCVRSEKADMAYVWLRYGQSLARLSASRVAEESERWMKVTYSTGEVLIDFNKKTLSNTTEFALDENFADSDIAKDSLGAAMKELIRGREYEAIEMGRAWPARRIAHSYLIEMDNHSTLAQCKLSF